MGHAMESLSEPGDASSGREPVYNRDCALGEPSGADTSYPDTAYATSVLRYCALRRGSGAPGPQENVPSGGALDASYLINTEKCARTRKVRKRSLTPSLSHAPHAPYAHRHAPDTM